jgi:hypothetical protein
MHHQCNNPEQRVDDADPDQPPTAGRPAPATRKISNAISCSTTARRFTARDPAALDGQGTSAAKVRREGQHRDDVSRADLILVPRHTGHPPTVRP